MYDDNIKASNSLTGNGEKAGPGPLLLKILVPAYAAGSIIGKYNNLDQFGLKRTKPIIYSFIKILKNNHKNLNAI